MPPVAAIVTGFVLVAVPAIILMTIWAGVTMWRLVFPDDELPFDRSAVLARAQERGDAVPVGFTDILAQQRRQPAAPVMPQRLRVGPDARGSDAPLADDLWRRRN